MDVKSYESLFTTLCRDCAQGRYLVISTSQIAKLLGKKYETVKSSDGITFHVDVSEHKEYLDSFVSTTFGADFLKEKAKEWISKVKLGKIHESVREVSYQITGIPELFLEPIQKPIFYEVSPAYKGKKRQVKSYYYVFRQYEFQFPSILEYMGLYLIYGYATMGCGGCVCPKLRGG